MHIYDVSCVPRVLSRHPAKMHNKQKITGLSFIVPIPEIIPPHNANKIYNIKF